MQLDRVRFSMEMRQRSNSMQLLQLVFGKRKGLPFSLLIFIAPIGVLGCLRAILPYSCPSFGLFTKKKPFFLNIF